MREPTLNEVNQELRRMKRLLKENEEVRDGLKFLGINVDLEHIEKTIENQKEIIKCLNHIKEKIS